VSRSMSRKVLVIANETVAGRELMDAVKERAEGGEVLVVAPALNTRLRHLFADVDKAREAAEGRLHESLKHLEEAGIHARGAVGDTDPVRAMGDALFEFDADEIIISTHPPGRSNWMEKGVVDRARAETDIPITHVVVDLDRVEA
jgi:hypothetical protein